jgi:hypothetical protein
MKPLEAPVRKDACPAVHPTVRFFDRGPTPKALPEVMLFNYGLLYSPIPIGLSSRNNDFLKEINAILRPVPGPPVGQGQFLSGLGRVLKVSNLYGIWNNW